MQDGSILILRGHEVVTILAGRELEVLEVVRAAYEAHGEGRSSLPHSLFLRFPNDDRNRIIALPAYLGHNGGAAGLKWVSSFPGNLESGLDRASAVLIMNSARTGRPEAFIEGSVISAKRTAASAALAAKHLHGERPSERIGVLGCGLINFEVVRFLRAVYPDAASLVVYDVDEARARQFARRCERAFKGIEAEVASNVNGLLAAAPLVSLATTAVAPHITDLSACAPGSTLLHVSLRDLAPEAILACDNVVDDVDHVVRAQTSLHLAEQLVGHRDFVRCTLADVMAGDAAPRRDDQSIAVFSPFGLGVLDIAVGKYVLERAAGRGLGETIGAFLPEPWREHDRA